MARETRDSPKPPKSAKAIIPPPQPVRLRLSIDRGFNLQELSLATNGLAAVHVGRPSKWGNWVARKAALAAGEIAVAAFRLWLEEEATDAWKAEAVAALRGKNLACWCPLDAPCHGDVLLDLVNAAR